MPERSPSTLSTILAVLLVLAMVEIAARVLFVVAHLHPSSKPVVEYPFQPYLGWENHPNFTDSGQLAGGRYRWTIRNDSLGESETPLYSYRDPDVRVVVVGGSAMYGHGQTQNGQTVPSQIERLLNERTGLRVEVHNLAVRGYTSFQEMLGLERFLSDHPADVIVSVSGFNDAIAAALDDGREFGLLLHRVDPKVELIRSIERADLNVVPVAAALLLRALRRSSRAVDLLGKIADRARQHPPVPWNGIPAPDGAETARRARCVLANYAMMDAMARQNGARFFMFLQPTAMTRKSLTQPEHQALDSLDRALTARTTPVVRVFYSTVLAADKAFEFHDLTHGFDAFDGPAFADDCHYLPRATGYLAGEICDVIAPAVVEAGRRGHPIAGKAAGARR